MEYETDVQAAVKALATARSDYNRYREYYDGKQKLTYSTGRTQRRYGSLFEGFRDNLCRPCVQATLSRLRLESISTGKDETDKRLVDLLKLSNFDWLQRRAHEDALVCGETFLIAWTGADGAVRLNWNPAGLVMPVYEPGCDRRMRLAVKMWSLATSVQDDSKGPVRIAVYYPDRVERFISASGGDDPTKSMVPYNGDGEPEVQAHGFGVVPVVHLDAQQSDLADALPLQDALNKSGFDLLVGMEFHSLPQRFATGIDPDIGADGRPELNWEKGSLWWTGNENARFGQLEPPGLGDMLLAGDSWRLAIARATRTPLHYLVQGRDFPSGEALRVAEAPFLAKLDGLCDEFGEGWEFAAALVLGADDWSGYDAVWADRSPFGEQSRWETALTKEQAGVSRAQVLLEAGYTVEQVAEMEAARKADDTAKAQSIFRAP